MRSVRYRYFRLKPKKRVTTDLRVEVGGESPWDKRMSEIKNKLNR